MVNNSCSVNEIKEVLNRFQEGFTKKDISKLDYFVKDMFSLKEGLAVLGNGLKQCAYSLEDIKYRGKR